MGYIRIKLLLLLLLSSRYMCGALEVLSLNSLVHFFRVYIILYGI